MIHSKRTEALLVAVALVIVFFGSYLVLQRTQGIAPHIFGVEGYYHMALARVIHSDGVPQDFPWMRFSLFRSGYADLELLFHLGLSTLAGSDNPDLLEIRAKTAVSILGAALLTLFFLVLRRFRCPWASLWTAALLCGASGFFIRLVQLRSANLSLVLLLLAVLLFSRRQKHHWPHLILGLLFSLTSPAPHLLTGMALLFLLGRRLAGERPLDFRMPLSTVAGTAVGILVNPDRWDSVRLLATMGWRALLSGLISGSGVPAAVEAMESKSPRLDDLLMHNELVILPLALLLLALMAKRRTGPSVTGETVSLFLCSMTALGLTMSAARFTPHWAVFTTLFSALLLRDLLAESRDLQQRGRPHLAVAVPVLLILAVAGIRTHDAVSDHLTAESIQVARSEMRDIGAILDNEAQAGDVIFHTRWVYFPQLFFYAPRQHYLVGSDPMLMLAYGEQYLEIWNNLRKGKMADSYPFVRGLFTSRYLLASKSQERLLRRLDRDPRFAKRYQGRSLILFRLLDSDPGFVTSWQVAPLAEAPFTGESAVTGSEPVTGQPADGLRLTPYRPSAPAGGISSGYIDFRPFFPMGGMAPPAARAETTLTLDQTLTEVEIRFGSSGPCLLELNGERLLANRDANRMALIDQWRCRATLVKGKNRLRVVAARAPRDWGFFLRVVDSAGRPVTFDRP